MTLARATVARRWLHDVKRCRKHALLHSCAGNWFTYAADVRARYQGLRHPPVVPTETLLVGEALALRGMP